jgi:hypothetical protein
MVLVVPAPLRLLVLALASGCVPAASPTVAGDGVGATPAPAAAPVTSWVVTAALPRQQISRVSAGLAAGARGWATLRGRWGTTPTLFYPLTPTPEDPDLLVVDSPLTDEQVMTRSERFLGVLAQACERTARPGECHVGVTLAVSGDGPPGPEPGSFRSVDLSTHVVADTSCAPATPRAFTVTRSHCPGAELGGRSDCPVEAARDGGYWIGPFRVLLAASVGDMRPRPLTIAALLALVAGCASQARPSGSTPRPRSGPRALALGEHVTGSTAGWDWRTGPGGDDWTFDAPRTASYRIHLRSSDHTASFTFRAKGGGQSYDSHGRGATRRGGEVTLSRPLAAGRYGINIDGNAAYDRGRYELWVEEDRTDAADLLDEDPDLARAACAAAPRLEPAARGVFEGRRGGVRASCGGTGGATVYRVDVPARSTLRIDASAEFRFALELRSACTGGPPVACVAPPGHDGALRAEVEPGTYWLVVDTTDLGPPMETSNRASSTLPRHPIRGAFSLVRAPDPPGLP